MQIIQCDFIETDGAGDQFAYSASVNMKSGAVEIVSEPHGHEKCCVLFRGVEFEVSKSELGYVMNSSELALLGEIRKRN